jgi:hypothetical protein
VKSEAQITQERKAWARGKLTDAWSAVAKAAADPDLTAEDLDVLEAELREAMAAASEWGIDPKTVVEEVEAGA